MCYTCGVLRPLRAAHDDATGREVVVPGTYHAVAASPVSPFDAVVAMTNGGPGDTTDVPTKFIIDNLFDLSSGSLSYYDTSAPGAGIELLGYNAYTTGSNLAVGETVTYTDVTDESDRAMQPPLCWITNAFDRSPSELLWIPKDAAWGPLNGSLLNLSYGYGQIYTVPHEFVNGQAQGGMCAALANVDPASTMASLGLRAAKRRCSRLPASRSKACTMPPMRWPRSRWLRQRA